MYSAVSFGLLSEIQLKLRPLGVGLTNWLKSDLILLGYLEVKKEISESQMAFGPFQICIS